MIPGSRRFLGEGNGYLLQSACLRNPMDRGTWQATVHGVAKSRTRLSDYHFHYQKKKRTLQRNKFKVKGWGFPGGSVVKNSPTNAGNMGLIPGPGGSHMPRSNKVHVPQLLSLCSRPQEPQLLSPCAAIIEAQAPQSPCSTTRETTATRSLHTIMKSSPYLPQLEKAHAAKKQKTKPIQPKINK